jgi:hypothetical protein
VLRVLSVAAAAVVMMPLGVEIAALLNLADHLEKQLASLSGWITIASCVCPGAQYRLEVAAAVYPTSKP